MTQDQYTELMSLISAYGRASEELGGVTSSMFWNSAYFKQGAAYKAIQDYINQTIEITQ